jgi:flagellar biosynthesis chaperone FliJ
MGRDMGNEIVAVRARGRDDLQTKVTQIIDKYRRRAKALTERYDTETDHSRNRQAQKKWDDAIQSAMKSGDPF